MRRLQMSYYLITPAVIFVICFGVGAYYLVFKARQRMVSGAQAPPETVGPNLRDL